MNTVRMAIPRGARHVDISVRPPRQTPAAADSGVTLPTARTRLALADALSTNDPNTRLASAFTDGGDGVGITAQLTGGWSTSDPFDGAYIVWEAKDAAGVAITSTTDIWSIVMELAERTAPGLSSDLAVIVGVMNENADSAGVDAAYVGIRYSGASRNGLRGHVTAGTSTMSHGTANANIRYIDDSFYRQGVGTVATTAGPGFTLDSARAILSSAGLVNTISLTTLTWGDARPYIFMSFIRTAATAGTETAKADAYYIPPVPLPIVA